MSREEELLEVAGSGSLADLRKILPPSGVLGKLIAPRFDINARDARGRTALMHATQRGELEMVRLLLERGADPNARDDRGDTALFAAAAQGNVEMTRLLLEAGADATMRNEEGYGPLHRAAGPEGRPTSGKVAEMLIAHGADPNAKGNRGDTALHVSAQHATVTVATALLNAGANVDECDGRGRTPLQLALRSGNLQIAWLLRKRGARGGEEVSRANVRHVRDAPTVPVTAFPSDADHVSDDDGVPELEKPWWRY